MNEITYNSETGASIMLSSEIIKQYLVNGNGKVSDQEIMMFLQLCKYQKLNPFLREVYLIKYGDNPATIVTGKEVFTKRAERNENYIGFEAGICIVTKDGDIKERQGTIILKDEYLAGGWAKVYRKGYQIPIVCTVNFDEYCGRKKDGTLNSLWANKPTTMIRKVALVQALREAFPTEFGGMYSQEEINTIDIETLPTREIQYNVEDMADFVRQEQTAATEGIDAKTAGKIKLNFGKFKGETLADIYRKDIGYFEWLSKADKTADNIKKACQVMIDSVMEIAASKQKPSADISPGDIQNDGSIENMLAEAEAEAELAAKKAAAAASPETTGIAEGPPIPPATNPPPEARKDTVRAYDIISPAQVKRLYSVVKGDKDSVDRAMLDWGYNHADDIKKADYDEIVKLAIAISPIVGNIANGNGNTNKAKAIELPDYGYTLSPDDMY
jgi:phage recombination protein Bet